MDNTKSPREYYTKRSFLLGCLFIIFIFLRLFIPPLSPSVSLAADNIKYLELAKKFPHHLLYNDQLYLLHPPGFPYVIHMVDIFVKHDHISTILISLLSSIVIFFVLYLLLMRLTKNFFLTYLVLIFYTISVALIRASNTVLKESFVVMLMLLILHYFIKGIADSNKKSISLAIVFGSILALTSDHVIFIFPALILSYVFFSPKKIELMNRSFPNIWYVIVPFVIILAMYGSWMFIKYYQYSHYEYYPNGTEGTPVLTKGFGLIHIINPQHFEDWSGSYIQPGFISLMKKIVFQIGYMFNMEPFSIPLGLNFKTAGFLLFPHHIAFMILVYLPLALAAFYGFYVIIGDFLKNKSIRNNANLYMLGVFFIFLLPITQAFVSPRYIYLSYLAFFYVVGLGIYHLVSKLSEQQRQGILLLLTVALFLLVPFWYLSGNTQFVLSVEKVTQMQNTADWVNKNIEKDAAIMAQPGYGVKMIYLTGHRTIGLYPHPEKLADVIDYFNVSYVVFGRYFTYDAFSFAKESAEFIKKSPDYELVATIKEDYSRFFAQGDPMQTDEVYIYRVRRQ